MTNRELASLTILALLMLLIIVEAIRKPSFRKDIWNLFKAFSWKLQVALWCYFLCAALSMWIAWQIGLWKVEFVKESLLMILVGGIPLLYFKPVEMISGFELLKAISQNAVGFTVIVSAYFNLVSFPYVVEALMQVVVFLLGASSAVIERKKLGSFTNHLLQGALILYGLIFILLVSFKVYSHADSIYWSKEINIFILSGFYLFSMFPFAYLLALYSTLELIIFRFKIRNESLSLGVKVAAIVGTRESLKLAKLFCYPWLNEMAEAENYRNASIVMRSYRKALQ
ncbi:hypothetical protein [Arcanobacterium phocae]|uniref:hypothetical protein n=1 Tax=Arcanobacterium phocae TaxID=131112 RepID=UPI001C0F2491|nr:hypothetical protein [Arcanobacterium phocae]